MTWLLINAEADEADGATGFTIKTWFHKRHSYVIIPISEGTCLHSVEQVDATLPTSKAELRAHCSLLLPFMTHSLIVCNLISIHWSEALFISGMLSYISKISRNEMSSYLQTHKKELWGYEDAVNQWWPSCSLHTDDYNVLWVSYQHFASTYSNRTTLKGIFFTGGTVNLIKSLPMCHHFNAIPQILLVQWNPSINCIMHSTTFYLWTKRFGRSFWTEMCVTLL